MTPYYNNTSYDATKINNAIFREMDDKRAELVLKNYPESHLIRTQNRIFYLSWIKDNQLCNKQIPFSDLLKPETFSNINLAKLHSFETVRQLMSSFTYQSITNKAANSILYKLFESRLTTFQNQYLADPVNTTLPNLNQYLLRRENDTLIFCTVLIRDQKELIYEEKRIEQNPTEADLLSLFFKYDQFIPFNNSIALARKKSASTPMPLEAQSQKKQKTAQDCHHLKIKCNYLHLDELIEHNIIKKSWNSVTEEPEIFREIFKDREEGTWFIYETTLVVKCSEHSIGYRTVRLPDLSETTKKTIYDAYRSEKALYQPTDGYLS